MQGQLVAVNLGSGEIEWRVPLGSLEDEYGPGAKDMGAASIGPTLATAGGLVFAAATDDRFYAYDSRRGRLLWQIKMPASSDAGPMTYIGKDGRQYVVIAAGGPGNAHRPSPRENAVYHQVLDRLCAAQAGREAGGHHRALSPQGSGPRTLAAELGLVLWTAVDTCLPEKVAQDRTCSAGSN